MSRLEAPTGTKGWSFIPVGGSNQDKSPAQPFVPVGATNQDKRPPLLSWLVSPTGTKLLGPLIPFPLSPPEPFSSLVLAVFGSGERSFCSFLHHICEDL